MRKSERYLNAIVKREATLIIEREGGIMFKSNSSSVYGLIKASEQELLKGSIVYDKLIGLGAAKIIVWSGATKIYCLTASRRAVTFCKKNKIQIKARKIKEFLGDQASNETCQIEKIASDFNDLGNLIKNLKLISNVNLEESPKDGVFPDWYYTTTNLGTEIRLKDQWLKVKNIEMDKGIKVNLLRKSARCICGNLVKKGDLIVVGEAGVKAEEFKDKREKVFFGFMGSEISSERNKDFLIRRVALMMKKIKKKEGKILFVVGPAIIHTGGGKYLAKIIKRGFVDILFTGNALAVHDLEEQYFGTSLGFGFNKGVSVKGGNHHHLWVINSVRKHGSIKKFLEAEKIKTGIIHECLEKKVALVLAGSIRDDGPLPEVITDTQTAQQKMRQLIHDNRVKMAIMCATTLHSIAAGNLLPARVAKVVVDINQAMITKLADRGTNNTIGIVTDTELFLKELSENLKFANQS